VTATPLSSRRSTLPDGDFGTAARFRSISAGATGIPLYLIELHQPIDDEGVAGLVLLDR
jgi:hypothetical protein